ncbi:hypothetical protein [Paraburkholderia bannensis]|uniref:hypothetical protein n=1 Tax=Paraburkholderia bannensis TaxID=765414 RepID=UPI002ABE29A8|nr:hypothetical protein [Paraburkholderia bannensis]
MSRAALARQHAPGVTVIANGSLHDAALSPWVVALSNPDWPQKWRVNHAMKPFEPEMLTPLAELKQYGFVA